jgi:type IV secretory pathway VirJ component
MKISAPLHSVSLLLLIIAFSILNSCINRDVTSISLQDSGEWGSYELWEPAGTVKGLVFFFSAKGGFEPIDRDAARALTRLGAAVAMVNIDVYLSRIDRSANPKECLYLPGPVEWTSHYLQQKLGLTMYRKPLLLGRSAGAGIVFALLAQGSSESFAGGMSVDFSPFIPLQHPLCDHPPVSQTANGQMIAGSTRLCGWWRCAASTGPPGRDTLEFVGLISAANSDARPAISGPKALSLLVSDVFSPVMENKSDEKNTAIAGAVVEVSRTSTRRILAVIYSGDGGWSDIDRELGNYLASHDIAVAGVNCLSYFWKKRTADEVGRDLEWLLKRYIKDWAMEHVVLIGYSFGADILPSAYNILPGFLKDKVVQISLLAPGRTAEFEFHISDWLGSGASEKSLPLQPEVAKIDKATMQCFYGEEEKDESLCTDSVMNGAETIKTSGSHHFDGNYTKLGDTIITGALGRIADSKPITR